jgi:predicted alpha/beta-fold hydrolase
LPNETEAVILEIAFPPDGMFYKNKPVYLVLHGINGGSTEGYVADFIHHAIHQGSTVVVMVTRGLMDSPLLGDKILHFARTSDVSAAARALRNALGNEVFVGGIGYSMGGITLANYVARSGELCALDAAGE